MSRRVGVCVKEPPYSTHTFLMPPSSLRLAERFRQAGTAQQAAEAQVAAVQQQLERTQREAAELRQQVTGQGTAG